MTNQEAFDGGLAHMRRQRVRSVRPTGDGACVYRAPGGLRCIVGGIMPNSQYRRAFDSEGAMITADRLPDAVLPGVDRSLLVRMQGVHDFAASGWGPTQEGLMAGIAAEFGLTYTPPETT